MNTSKEKLPVTSNRPIGLNPAHILHYLNKGLNDVEIATILKCTREAIKYHRNKLNFNKDEIDAFKQDREKHQQFLQARITGKQIDFLTSNADKSEIANWAEYKAATVSKACEVDKEVVTINNFGTTNVSINAVDDKIQALKERLKAKGIDSNTIDVTPTDKK